MNQKHLRARIDQCLRNAELSRCPRRKFGAMLVDPKTNSIVADGYNGPPRGEEGLCKGWFCERDGVNPARLQVTNEGECLRYYDAEGNTIRSQMCEEPRDILSLRMRRTTGTFQEAPLGSKEEVEALRERLLTENPPVPSGTQLEKGCHHAETNALANAARRGVSTDGTWLIVTGEP